MSYDLKKTIERNRNSLEELSSFADVINKNAWTFSYLYPEDFGPAPYPDNHSFPTTVATNRFIRQFKVNTEGEFLIYYSPVSETFASYFNIAKVLDTTLDRGTLTEYITYADNNSQPLPLIDSKLKNASTWSYFLRPSPKFQHFKMIRLIGASLEIFIDDIEQNHSGIIEGGMSFAVAGAGIQSDQINPDRMQNFSQYNRFSTRDPLVFRYRAPNNNFMEFGPYEPFMQVPYFIIRGRGLSQTATIGVVVTNHVEGVFWPEFAHFSLKQEIPQIPGEEQKLKAEQAAGKTIIESQKDANLEDRAAQTSSEIAGVKYYHNKNKPKRRIIISQARNNEKDSRDDEPDNNNNSGGSQAPGNNLPVPQRVKPSGFMIIEDKQTMNEYYDSLVEAQKHYAVHGDNPKVWEGIKPVYLDVDYVKDFPPYEEVKPTSDIARENVTSTVIDSTPMMESNSVKRQTPLGDQFKTFAMLGGGSTAVGLLFYHLFQKTPLLGQKEVQMLAQQAAESMLP